jgi:cell division protein ZapA (FtsZ GTPase activity inhibitor)
MGRELSVRSSASPEKVLAVESFVNERLSSITAALKNSDTQMALILALLNTSEELLELRSRREDESVLENRLLNMLEKLESA